jgi:GT2 family glycosyltransferase
MEFIRDGSILASIIIPVYKNWNGLSECLAALEVQPVERDLFEIIVVNNDPMDQAPTWLQMPANGSCIVECRKGSYAARNRGVREARGGVLCFIDSDCIPAPSWLSAIIGTFERDEAIARVGGPVVTPAPSTPSVVAHYDHLFSFTGGADGMPAGWAVTANMAVRRAVYDDVGPFDERLLSGGDLEWGMRAQARNWPIRFVESAIVHHQLRTSLRETLVRERRLAAGRLEFRVRARGKSKIRRDILLATPVKLLPSARTTRRAWAIAGLPLWLRLKLSALMYLIRVVGHIEAIRILVFGGEPERR